MVFSEYNLQVTQYRFHHTLLVKDISYELHLAASNIEGLMVMA
jgi:hypothetical protein